MTASTRTRLWRYPWVAQVFVILMALFFVIPLYLLINLSLKKVSDTSSPFALVTAPTLENFVDAWNQAGLAQAFLNTIIITVVSTTILIALAAAASYPLARATKRWGAGLYYGFMLGMVLPFQLGMFPLYSTLRSLGLIGTIPGMILYYSGHMLPFCVFMYTTFLRRLDRDYEEAAALDGAGRFRMFWSVVFPLMRPVTGTLVILEGLTIWNDFFAPLIFLSGTTKTVPVALYGFVSSYYSNWSLVFAGLIMSALPLVVLYFFMQRSIIRGFAGGLKG